MSQTSDANGPWTIQSARELYNIHRWGANYFDINEAGHVVAKPQLDDGCAVDLTDVVEEARGRGLHMPLLIRFQDILRHRVEVLNQSFRDSIAEFNYQGRYQGVFPIKVNQLREVVEAHGTPSWTVPEEVGGRFSVFTPANTIALALAGHDVPALLEGARAMRGHCAKPGSASARLAGLLTASELKGRNVVALWAYSVSTTSIAVRPGASWSAIGCRSGEARQPSPASRSQTVGASTSTSAAPISGHRARPRSSVVAVRTTAAEPAAPVSCRLTWIPAAMGRRAGSTNRTSRSRGGSVVVVAGAVVVVVVDVVITIDV